MLPGGDFSSALGDIDKRGGRSFESKRAVIQHINELKSNFDQVARLDLEQCILENSTLIKTIFPRLEICKISLLTAR